MSILRGLNSMLECKTRFGSLYVEEMPMSEYALIDSEEKVIQYYDNDMPLRWLSDNTLKRRSVKDFFNQLALLLGDCFLVYAKSKRALFRELKELDIEADIEDTFRVGKYLVWCDFGGFYDY